MMVDCRGARRDAAPNWHSARATTATHNMSTPAPSTARSLADLVVKHLQAEPQVCAWYEQLFTHVVCEGADGRFLAAFAGMGRRVGEHVVAVPSSAEADRLREALGGPWPASISLADLARMSICCAMDRAWADRAAQERVAVMVDLYYKGALGEQLAVLRALPLMAEPERYLELAIDACRTNVASVFAAIALDNAYPALWFPEHAFNQLVMKTIFLELDARAIFGLRDRANPELERMLDDFAAERRAAGRAIPFDARDLASLDAAMPPER